MFLMIINNLIEDPLYVIGHFFFAAFKIMSFSFENLL